MTDTDAVRVALIDADRQLTASGARFETVQDTVLGERMLVFRRRPSSLRAVLAGAGRFGDRDCFVFSDGQRTTFEEVSAEVASVAAYLRDVHGVRKGDRVAICATNSRGWLLLLWATISLGAITVAMNGWWSQFEMGNALALTEPVAVFADKKRGARLSREYSDIDEELGRMLAHAPGASLPVQPIDEDDPAALVFTSGTTGRPKAACLSHRALVAFVMLQDYIGARGALQRGIEPGAVRPPTRLAVFPLFHVSGLGATLTAMSIGATTVWPLGRFDPAAVIELTVRERIGMWGGTVTHISRLLDHPDIEGVDPQQLVAVGAGGSATTPELMRRSDARFPHLAGTMTSGYGSTETGGLVSWAPNAMLATAADCVGPVLPTVLVRISDVQGQWLEDGCEGDIWVRSPLVMIGYWNNDEANAEVFVPGRWFRTGDFGRMENGVLFIASRRRDLIIRGGENIYPFEIENRLEEHPEVREAAVVPVDHDVLGQEVRAIVVVGEGSTLDADAVRAYCAEALADYKVPVYVEFRTTPLPRNPTGKVLKRALIEGDTDTFVEASL